MSKSNRKPKRKAAPNSLVPDRLSTTGRIADGEADPSLLEEAAAELVQMAAELPGDDPLRPSAQLWAALLEMAEVADEDQQREEIISFSRAGLQVFLRAAEGDPDALGQLELLQEDAVQQWETLPWLLEDLESFGSLPSESDADPLDDQDLDDLDQLNDDAPIDAEALKQALEEITAPEDGIAARRTSSRHPDIAGPANTPQPLAPQPSKERVAAPPTDVTPDAELLEAFLDDARRGLIELEAAALELEGDPRAEAARKRVGRELHTLKGAAACVGLARLAAELHGAEELLETEQLDVARLLATVDAVGRQVARLEAAATPAGQAGAPNRTVEQRTPRPAPLAPAPSADQLPSSANSSEGTQRIRTAQLDRLMDMLAELVMLRNRRQSGVDALGEVHGDLHHAAEQLKRLSDKLLQSVDSLPPEAASQLAAIGSLTEVAEDLQHSLRHLRDFYEPLARDNQAVTGFIGQFRQELASLRRMPVSALFHRLRRVARDAARAENKEVQLTVAGGELGVEPSIQDRLYEPLLHIVRNAVSHGIEPPAQRTAAGKPAAGRVTLTASGGASLVHLEIRDDGQGLDYEAIRRRGVERGLLGANRAVSRRELAQLIFHPGFSTRESVSELAGRGVGMDIVASTLDQMRGWIDVESEPGEGTTIRITLPLPSVIEHMMVFRTAGRQLYGLPMQALEHAGDRAGESGATPAFEQLLGENAGSPLGQPLWLQQEEAGRQRRADSVQAMSVSEVVGPEEAVVRPLPPLLSHHPLLSGLSLSGNGDVVLLLEPRELCRQLQTVPHAEPATAPCFHSGGDGASVQVLVVDDSKTARLRIARPLEAAGFEVLQAGDGAAALELLHDHELAVRAVFTDLEMPVMDGFELLRELQADARFAELPVVVASTLRHPSQQRRTASLGAVAHLGKPVAPHAVTALIHQLLAAPAGAAATAATAAMAADDC